MTELDSKELRGCPAGNPREMQKSFLWIGALMFVCILALLAMLIKYTGQQPSSSKGEDGLELQLAAGNAPNAAGPFDHQVVSIPSGLGGQQMQLIAQNGPYLGLGLADAPAQPGGKDSVVVSTVIPGSPGEKAGIAAGDVVLSLDQKTISTTADVGPVLAGKRPGDVVKAVINSAGSVKSTHITLGNVPLGASVGDPGDAVWLGADIQNIDAIIRIQFNLPDASGVIISYVAPQSPAEAAGLTTGDVIKRIGETRISDVKQVAGIISKSAPGQQLRMVVERKGRPMNVAVDLSRRPPGPTTVPMVAPPDVTVEAAWIGMGATELTPKDVTALGLPQGTRGILVSDVEGRAMGAGFQSGDVILAVNNVPTPDMEAFVAAASGQAGAVAEILRGYKHLFLSVPPPGFTAQGTQLNTGVSRKFQQVAATGPALVAVLATRKNLESPVGSEGASEGLILVDQSKKSYAVVELANNAMLPSLAQQLGVAALICADISPQTANVLKGSNVAVYSGVTGNVLQAVNLYQQQGLVPAGGR